MWLLVLKMSVKRDLAMDMFLCSQSINWKIISPNIHKQVTARHHSNHPKHAPHAVRSGWGIEAVSLPLGDVCILLEPQTSPALEMVPGLTSPRLQSSPHIPAVGNSNWKDYAGIHNLKKRNRVACLKTTALGLGVNLMITLCMGTVLVTGTNHKG